MFDFGLSRFMPQYSHGQEHDAYDEVYEMSGAGTLRYSPPEVIFEIQPQGLCVHIFCRLMGDDVSETAIFKIQV